jgi:hypothetical protein
MGSVRLTRSKSVAILARYSFLALHAEVSTNYKIAGKMGSIRLAHSKLFASLNHDADTPCTLQLSNLTRYSFLTLRADSQFFQLTKLAKNVVLW